MEIRCGLSFSGPGYFTALPQLFPGRLSRIYVPVSQPPIELMRIWAPWHCDVFTYLHFELAVAPSEVTRHSDATHAVNLNCKECQNSLADDANKDQRDAHTTTKLLRCYWTIIYPIVQMIVFKSLKLLFQVEELH